jgi:hypothetical protein
MIITGYLFHSLSTTRLVFIYIIIWREAQRPSRGCLLIFQHYAEIMEIQPVQVAAMRAFLL